MEPFHKGVRCFRTRASGPAANHQGNEPLSGPHLAEKEAEKQRRRNGPPPQICDSVQECPRKLASWDNRPFEI